MRAAVPVRDVVAEGERDLCVRVDVLHREVDAQRLLLVRRREGDDRALQRLLLVAPRHVAADPVGAVEGRLAALAARVDAFVDEADAHAGVQVRELAQAAFERLVAEFGVGEDLRVGKERDARARPPRGRLGDGQRLDELERLRHLAAREADVVGLLVLVDLDLGPLAERVDALHADAVEAARDLVRVVAELAARVDLGEDDLDGGAAVDLRVLVLHRAYGHAAAVVDHGARAVDADAHGDGRGEAGHDLVDGVVDALVDEVVEGVQPGAADVHAGALADRLEALEDLDRVGGVGAHAGAGGFGIDRGGGGGHLAHAGFLRCDAWCVASGGRGLRRPPPGRRHETLAASAVGARASGWTRGGILAETARNFPFRRGLTDGRIDRKSAEKSAFPATDGRAAAPRRALGG